MECAFCVIELGTAERDTELARTDPSVPAPEQVPDVAEAETIHAGTAYCRRHLISLVVSPVRPPSDNAMQG